MPCSREALALALRRVGHPGVATALGIVVGVALPSALLFNLFGQSRVFLAMSRDRLLPVLVSMVNRRLGTPHRITLLTGGMVTLAAAFLPIGRLARLVNAGTLFAFMLVVVSELRLRRIASDIKRPFRVRALTLVVLITVGGCGVLLVSLPWPSLFSLSSGPSWAWLIMPRDVAGLTRWHLARCTVREYALHRADFWLARCFACRALFTSSPVMRFMN